MCDSNVLGSRINFNVIFVKFGAFYLFLKCFSVLIMVCYTGIDSNDFKNFLNGLFDF